MSSLKNRNIVITGATRGIGRGLALALAQQSANLHITGRTASGPNSLEYVSAVITAAGGTCHSYVVDHNDDSAVADFFTKLSQQLEASGGTLDVFVNNAYAAVDYLTESDGVPFWKKSADEPRVADPTASPGRVWDLVNGVGLRNNYVCAVHAMRIMEQQGSGVLVNMSSWGGMMSLFDVAYCVGKSAIDRMTAEMAKGAPPGVVCVTLWPGLVSTERMVDGQTRKQQKETAEGGSESETSIMWNAETPIFVGRVLGAMLEERQRPMLKSMHGKIVVTAEVAERLKVDDENGFRPLSLRSLRFFFMHTFPSLRESPLRKIFPRKLCYPWGIIGRLFGNVSFWS
eukprot:GFKZ01013922.1.p1 GENE.GFKZ01013922.1~~GFKZ01013922.1.p1  ORF type:complete len:343 (-),score=38.56 GFKZ01013922.1:344-1372(-)